MGNANPRPTETSYRSSFEERLNAVEFLRRIKDFEHFTEVQIKQVGKCLKGHNFFDQEIIFQQGDESKSAFFVSLGEVNLFRKDENGKEVFVRTYLEGEMLGVVEMLQNWTYQCTAKASGEVSVFELSREMYQKLSGKPFAKPIAQRFSDILRFTKVEYMRKIHFLRTLPKESLHLISQILRLEIIPTNTVLLKEGEKGDKCYFIIKGQVFATVKDRFGFDIELTSIDTGRCVGERNFLTGKNCVATIVTVEETQVFSLNNCEFQDLLDKLPEMKQKLKRQQKIFHHVESILEEVDIFKALSNRKKQLLGYCVKPLLFRPGEIILQEGFRKKYEMIYIIVEGKCEVFLRNKKKTYKELDEDGNYVEQPKPLQIKKVREMTRGNFFGEIGLITDEASSATVKVTDDAPCKCLCISKASFLALFSDDKNMLSEICIRVLGKSTPLIHILNNPKSRSAFESHCKQELSVENINFYLSVLELEEVHLSSQLSPMLLQALRIEPETLETRKKTLIFDKCRDIFEKFIKEDSAQEINIEYKMRDEICQKMDHLDISWDMFTKAKNSVFQLMDSDIFARFKRNARFTDLLEQFKLYSYSENYSQKRITNCSKFSQIATNTSSSEIL